MSIDQKFKQWQDKYYHDGTEEQQEKWDDFYIWMQDGLEAVSDGPDASAEDVAESFIAFGRKLSEKGTTEYQILDAGDYNIYIPGSASEIEGNFDAAHQRLLAPTDVSEAPLEPVMDPNNPPECQCDSFQLARGGHEDDCPYVKWKAAQASVAKARILIRKVLHGMRSL